VRTIVVPRRVSGWVGFLAAPVVLVIVGAIASGNAYYVHLATSAAIAYILTAAFNLVYGYAGIFNLAIVGFYGIGAFSSVYLEIHAHQTFGVALLVSVVATSALSVLIALPTRRLNELFLAIETLAFALGLNELLTHWTSFSGGATGVYIVNPPTLFGHDVVGGKLNYYWLCAIFTWLTFEVMRRIDRSGAGRRFAALRVDRRTLSSVGSSPGSASLVAFGVSGFFAGLAGVLYAHFQLSLSLESFSFDRLIALLLATIIGGAGFLLGPVFGVIVLVAMDELSLATSSSQNLIYGVGILVLVALGRGGIAGLLTIGVRRFVPIRLQSISGQTADGTPEAAVRASVTEHSGRVLSGDHVSVSFGGTHAVRDMSLTICSGEIVGLIGPNGAGKTSIINAFSGDVRPSSGTIELGELPLNGKRQDDVVRLGIGRTFQSPKVIPEFTLIQNLVLARDAEKSVGWFRQLLLTPRARRRQAEAERLALQLLGDFGQADRAQSPAGGQPYGTLRLVEIARNLMLDPAFLLLDEPGAGLTDDERAEVGEYIKAVAARGIGVLLVDHNLELISAVCHRLYVMDAGQLVASGLPTDVFADEQVITAYLGVPQ
jgi:ABC-type branched-subunit amino acid transport system ATPase component/ABC-type branched-subunit amino acid transport system permease subunit